MDPVAEAAFSSWSIDPWLILAMVAALWIYARGWRRLHEQMPGRFPFWRLGCFAAGLAALFLAVASPLDAFGGLLLQVHMIQHLLMTAVAPPLLWLGQPLLAGLRGLPSSFSKDALGPYLRWGSLRRAARLLTHPLVCWVAMAFATVFWHLPRFYELALCSSDWHKVQHGCFFAAALLFWWPVIQVWPGAAQWPRWAMIPYLVSADVVNTVLSAVLTFSSQVLYPSYALAPRLWGIDALSDQAAAGAIMWVPGSVAYLVPAVVIGMQLLNAGRRAVRPSALVQIAAAGSSAAPARHASRHASRQRPAPWDLLELPLLGAVLRMRYFRRTAQAVMFLLAAAVIVDGFAGPQASPLNLAGVLPWTYWRAFAVLALLTAGNLFCMACPFTLPSDLARRYFRPRFSWPRRLRSKWIALVLVAGYFWLYEAHQPWDSPRLTAWIAAGYFLAATATGLVFKGAAFCKYVCPIGQFHFVNAFASPLEVKVREPEVCASCRTFDCVRGNAAGRGCETKLFLPRKTGNLDCTFCLDCVHACPSANIGVLAAPLAVLRNDSRAGSGRFSGRLDVAVLALVLVFGAFVNAAAMTGPGMAWMHTLHAKTGSMTLAATLFYLLGGIAAPAAAATLCSLQRRASKELARFSLALAPLGLAMWAAHFSFHLAASWRSILAPAGRVLYGAAAAVAPAVAAWIPSFQSTLLALGFSVALYLLWRIAAGCVKSAAASLAIFGPWAAVASALYAAGIWILGQPMDMMQGMMK